MNELGILKSLYCTKYLMRSGISNETLKNIFINHNYMEDFIDYIDYSIDTQRWFLFLIATIKDKIHYLLNEYRFINPNPLLSEKINNIIISLNKLGDLIKDELQKDGSFDFKYDGLDLSGCTNFGALLLIEGAKRDVYNSFFRMNELLEESNCPLIKYEKVLFSHGKDESIFTNNVIISMSTDGDALTNILQEDIDSAKLSIKFLLSVNALLSDFPYLFLDNYSYINYICDVIESSMTELKSIKNKNIRTLYKKNAFVTLNRINALK